MRVKISQHGNREDPLLSPLRLHPLASGILSGKYKPRAAVTDVRRFSDKEATISVGCDT